MDREDIIGSYKLAELVTLTRDGSPVCWPMLPGLERGRIVFSTGYLYPTKARNAQRDPRVAVLFSDPSASGRCDDDPLVLVQGRAEVLDRDIQRNTERYVDQLMRKATAFRLMLSVPWIRHAMAGYLARIWIEVVPDRQDVWARADAPPPSLRGMSRPAAFVPREPIVLPPDVFGWLPRYTRPPVLAYLDREGRPAAVRVQAAVRPDRIDVSCCLQTVEGAPACLTYHRLIGNYRGNDAFLIRGHFDAAGGLVPERLVGYGGTADDRELGSVKLLRLIKGWGKQLPARLAAQGRPQVVARPSSRSR
ncbi:MAG TPA: pyridoxamine 5'-phosphate oxidase family protein [Candidatus Limnocylindria bacterium]|nr:pyridoxamine 5'-phosphate oxidase family protein [Candidatus Limnocylindria bacterium]